MKVIVLGAGIIGVTSAYQLSRAGHEVTVIDRQPGPALETSFANAGEVSFGYCSPWAAPGIPMKALKWLFMQHAPLILRPRIDAAMLSWMAKMLSNCTSRRYAVNKSRMLRLADYSRTSLAALREETAITYDERMQGTLQLFAPRRSSTRRPRTSARSPPTVSPTRCSTATAASVRSRRWGACATRSSAAC